MKKGWRFYIKEHPLSAKTTYNMTNLTLFSQIVTKLNHGRFISIGQKEQTTKHNKGVDSWINLLPMLSCQFPKASHFGL